MNVPVCQGVVRPYVLLLLALLLISATVARAEVLYVSHDKGVSLIDPETRQVRDTYEIGASRALALDSRSRLLYVGSAEAFRVDVVNAIDGSSVSTLSLPGLPRAITVSPQADSLWVTHASRCEAPDSCEGESGLSVVDLKSGDLTMRFEDHMFRALRGVVFDGSGTTAYAVNLARSGFTAIDPSSYQIRSERFAFCCIGSLPVLHPDGHTVYALGWEFGAFLALADFDRFTQYAIGVFLTDQSEFESEYVWDLAFSPDGERAYLPGRNRQREESLFIVDTADATMPSLIDVVELEAPASRIAMSRDGGTAYLTSRAASSLMAFDVAARTTATMPLEDVPESIVVGPGEAEAFKVQGCVPHVQSTGCGTTSGSVSLEPLGLTARVELGYFVFEMVPPGAYLLRFSSPCDVFGCRPPIRVEVVDRDVFAFFQLVSRCPGDCGRDYSVGVDDVLRCVQFALNGDAEDSCRACDANSDFEVSVDEITLAVAAALQGCRGR